MSAAGPATAPPPATAEPQQPSASDACPLCGAQLAREQEWCLRCGAAARTRLAAAPNWKAPFAAVAVVAALSLGVLAAALVKLAGDTGPAPSAITHTVTAGAAAASTAATGAIPPTATAPAATATAPGAATAQGQTTATSPGATATAPAGAGGQAGSQRKTSTQRRPKLSPDAEKKIRELNLSGQINR